MHTCVQCVFIKQGVMRGSVARPSAEHPIYPNDSIEQSWLNFTEEKGDG